MLKKHFIEYTVDTDRYRESLILRNQLLRLPLGLNLFEEDLSGERYERHFGLVIDDALIGALIGCLVIRSLTPAASERRWTRVKLRQMCVAEAVHGRGCGRLLVESTARQLLSEGLESIELAARTTATRFYARLGFEVIGETFTEVTIPHRKMLKTWG